MHPQLEKYGQISTQVARDSDLGSWPADMTRAKIWPRLLQLLQATWALRFYDSANPAADLDWVVSGTPRLTHNC